MVSGLWCQVQDVSDCAKAGGFTTTAGSGEQGVSNKLGTVTRGGTLTVNGQAYVTGVTTSSAAFGYGGNGNVTDDGTYTYSYDPLNRLVAVRLKRPGVRSWNATLSMIRLPRLSGSS